MHLFYTGQTACNALFYFDHTERMLDPFALLRDPFLIETGRAHPENPADTATSLFRPQPYIEQLCGKKFDLIIVY